MVEERPGLVRGPPQNDRAALSDFEAHESTELARSVQPDGRSIEVGANFSLHSVLLATRLPGLHVDTFEPVPQTIELLRKNLAKNACEGVEVHGVAVSVTEGDVLITSGARHRQPHRPDKRVARRAGVCSSQRGLSRRFLAAARTRRPPVDAIKVDVEGAEWQVLHGGANFFGQGPVLLIELVDDCLRRFGHDTTDCIDLLRTYGYRFARPIGASREGDWSALSAFRPTVAGNFLFSRSPTGQASSR